MASSPGRSTSLPLMKVAPARTRATRWGALTARQRSWADSMSLNAIARPGGPRAGALGDLGPVPDRGEGGLDRVGRAQVDPVLGRVVVEGQQLLQVVGDLRGGLGELRPVGGLESLHRGEGVRLVLGVPDLRQGLLRARVRGLDSAPERWRLVEPAHCPSSRGRPRAARPRTPAPRRRRPAPGRACRGGRSRAAGPPRTRWTPGSHGRGRRALCGRRHGPRS